MRKLLFIIVILVNSIFSFADEGDTLIIQTIDYETPVNPGWNAPREGKYLFPSDTVSFSKILMSYKLICDPNQSPACGEWDYTTHTKIYEHTGVFDSTMYTHPKFKINNTAPDTLNMMNSISYYYVSHLEYSNNTQSDTDYSVGENAGTMDFPFGDASDGRAQFIYLKDELLESGLEEGDITSLKLSIDEGVMLKHFSIKIKSYDLDTMPVDSLINYGFTTVYERNTTLEIDENQINFSFPFNWDGNSNLLIDFSYAESEGSTTMAANILDSRMALQTANEDNFLHFSGWDLVGIPEEAFETVDSAITISFWQFGDPIKQPMNNSIFHANNIDNERVLNSHLPWSNGQVYWDAGQNDGYDRINRSASASEYKGQWNHWTFTKKTDNGSMKIFLNGQYFYLGSAKYKSMADITEFVIGGTKNSSFYEGMIDDFCVWDAELDYFTILEWFNRDINENHPNYESLRLHYKFDEGTGTEIHDNSGNNFDAISFFGQAEWKSYEGKNRHKNAEDINLRPFIRLQSGIYNANLLDSIVVVDTFAHAANNIIFYNPDNPTQPMDTILKWPEYYNNYVYDASANAIDSTLVMADTVLYNEEYIYYGEPFEILNPWEIGRFITPYGNNLSLGDGFTWVYDVTDYAPLLHDSVHISAGNFQELLDLEFHMIKGTPPRDVLKIDKVYSGYWNLNQFEEKVPPKNIDLLEEASLFRIKTRTTGHLFDNPTNCAEFCSKTQSFLVNDNEIASWEILQECAENPLYPQGGTWIYDRAGWCPGMDVTEQDIEISDYVSGNSVLVDYNSEYDEYGTYSLETHLFSYGDYNFSQDAGIVEIIAPNKLKRYGRFNPTATNPIIIIQNRGSETLTTVQIEYGPVGGESKIYNWTGELAPMESEEVILESFDFEQWQIGEGKFSASLSLPNGQEDENIYNDYYYSDYDDVDIYPGIIVIHFNTNKAAYQNSYEIIAANGVQIFEKDNFENETLYIDTISLVNGCYDFYLHDSGDNGISFWAETGQGNGSLKFYDLDGNKLKQFNGDFGDRIYKSFYADMYLGSDEFVDNDIDFNIYPNPNNGDFFVNYAMDEETIIKLKLIDNLGKVVYSNTYNGKTNANIHLSLDKLNSGIYMLSIEANGKLSNRKFVVK